MEAINIDISNFKKEAKSSFKKAFKGKDFLGVLPDVNENEIPFLLYSEQMDYLSDLAFNLKNDNFRLPIINKQLIEMKLLFIFRYEFKYGNKIYPFEYKWIYKKYNELKIERDLRNYLIN